MRVSRYQVHLPILCPICLCQLDESSYDSTSTDSDIDLPEEEEAPQPIAEPKEEKVWTSLPNCHLRVMLMFQLVEEDQKNCVFGSIQEQESDHEESAAETAEEEGVTEAIEREGGGQYQYIIL